MSGITVRVRAIVLERDGYCCVSCGRYIGPFGDYSIHHRQARGMGGTKLPAANLPGNLLTLCGSGTTGCHGWVESNRRAAEVWGYLVRRPLDPSTRPVLTFAGWKSYDNDGGVDQGYPANLGPERQAELDQDIAHAVSVRTGSNEVTR